MPLGNSNKQKVKMKSTDFQPRINSVLVKYQAPEKEVKSESGIVIEMQRSAVERQIFGEVVQVGDQVTWVKTGDKIVWAMTDGVNLDMEDGEFLLLRETSILGKQK